LPELPPLDLQARKAALRSFTYGLYAVTCRNGEQANAFTANWLTQASFDPPLVAVSVENDSRSLPMIRSSGFFAVNVLASGDRELAGSLGKPSRSAPGKLAGVDYSYGVTGCPLLKRAIAAVECRVVAEMPAGDSTIVLGEVVTAHKLGDAAPLTMAETGFRHFG
jgi:flavin reductase (DIM6/NTAB) family NADH-FMN oxidoreductase RutF